MFRGRVHLLVILAALSTGCPVRPRPQPQKFFRFQQPFPCGVRVRVSCTYGPRCSPGHRGKEFYAVDLVRDVPGHGFNKPVVAVAPGVVQHAGWANRRLRPHGKMVIIVHHHRDRKGRYYITTYSHLHRVLVREGEEVTAGTVIGTLGGSSSRRLSKLRHHLHFVLFRGVAPTLFGRTRSIRPEPMGAYKKLRQGMRMISCGPNPR